MLEKHKNSEDVLEKIRDGHEVASITRYEAHQALLEKARQQDTDEADRNAEKLRREAEQKQAALDKMLDDEKRYSEDLLKEIERRVRAKEAIEKKIASSDSGTHVSAEETRYQIAVEQLQRLRELKMAQFNEDAELQRVFNETELATAELHMEKMAEARVKDWKVELAERNEKRDAIKEFAEFEQQVIEERAKLARAYVNGVGSAFGTLATLLEEGSKAQRAALVIEKATATASALISFNTALMTALADKQGFPANMAAYGAVAATGAAVLANLAAVSVSGRASGGPVAPGGRYMVGEHGPEILTLGMTPGQITKAEDISPNVNVTIIEDAERAGQVQQEGDNVQVFVAAAMQHLTNEFNSGRGIWAAVENKYGLAR
jgi:hypothetical protein